MKHLKLATTVVVVLAAGIWLMQPEDPERKNPFGGEAQALSTGILSPREGLTLALERRTPEAPPPCIVGHQTARGQDFGS